VMRSLRRRRRNRRLRSLQTGLEMSLKTIIAVTMLCAAASAARAENCMQYPPGPARFDCASRNHPGLLAKQERCKQQAYDMGLRPGVGRSNGPVFKEYMQSCMHHPGRD
jgi:hypothetical protein